jgi:hypothetical protein
MSTLWQKGWRGQIGGEGDNERETSKEKYHVGKLEGLDALESFFASDQLIHGYRKRVHVCGKRIIFSHKN